MGRFDDQPSAAELGKAWENGNKKRVIAQIKSLLPGVRERLIDEIASEMSVDEYSSMLKMLALSYENKIRYNNLLGNNRTIEESGEKELKKEAFDYEEAKKKVYRITGDNKVEDADKSYIEGAESAIGTIKNEFPNLVVSEEKDPEDYIWKLTLVNGNHIIVYKRDKWLSWYTFLIPEEQVSFSNIGYLINHLRNSGILSDIELFKKLVDGFDYTYQYSDDHRYYASGEQDVREMRKIYPKLSKEEKDEVIGYWNKVAEEHYPAMVMTEDDFNKWMGTGKNEVIRKMGSKWQVQSKKGKNLGTYDTKKDAEERLRQVEYFKHKDESEVSEEELVDYYTTMAQDQRFVKNESWYRELIEKIKNALTEAFNLPTTLEEKISIAWMGGELNNPQDIAKLGAGSIASRKVYDFLMSNFKSEYGEGKDVAYQTASLNKDKVGELHNEESEEEQKTEMVIRSSNVPDEVIDDIMTTALEGGINYWASRAVPKDGNFHGAEYTSDVLTKGGTIVITETEGDNGNPTDHEITKADIIRGINQFISEMSESRGIPSDKNEVIEWLQSGDLDASDADIIVQYAIFNENVYA